MTPRQHQVAQLIARGLLNKAIARELGISYGTARIHVSAVLRELGVKNRTEAAVIIAGRHE